MYLVFFFHATKFHILFYDNFKLALLFTNLFVYLIFSILGTAERKYSFYPTPTAPTLVSNYYLIHSDFLSNLLEYLSCPNPNCKSSKLTFSNSSKSGLAIQFRVECLNCGAEFKDWSSPKPSKRFDVNMRSVLACKEVGIGYSKLTNFLAILNVTEPMHHSTYIEIGDEIRIASIEAAEDCMSRAADVIKEQTVDQPSTSAEGFPRRTISQDGTWQKRGHSSHNGVSSAIDFDTGLVLDFQVISNWCQACTNGPSPDDPGYDEWFTHHKFKCQKNFDGSSNAMEAEAAKLMWERSVRKRGIEYGTMLCDGDSKAFQSARAVCGYPVEKEDCINHIAKRMFNALDNLKKSNKSQILRSSSYLCNS